MSKLPVIALIDMDCFFVQVEMRGKPELVNKPCAVTQYNTYKGGGIIAVNYEARAFGVGRNMRGEDAKLKCPDIVLFHTPQRRGKADSSKYREASFEVFDVLANFDSELIVEKASIDEAYIDLTEYLDKNQDLELPNKEEMLDCFVEGVENSDLNVRDFDKFYDMINENPELYKDEINLLKGAKIVFILRKAIIEKTQFHCSAGISHSKVLAKLAAGLHKPKSQTILPNFGKKKVLAKTEIQNLRNLGGKFGLQIIERLQIKFVDQINNFTIEQLKVLFDEKTAEYMVNLANGIDGEKVVPRKLSKSIGCGKNFSAVGVNCLNTKEQVEHWIGQLVDELLERLDRDKELNNRRPTLLVLSMEQSNIGMLSRSTQFEYFGKERLIEILMNKIINPILFKRENKTNHPIKMLSVAATKFIDLVDHKGTIENFFQRQNKQQSDKKSPTSKEDSSSLTNDKSGDVQQINNQSDNQSIKEQQENQVQRSKIEFQNLNCKNMMKEYFRELEADITKPKEIAKPKLTILNMFTKIAEKTGHDIRSPKKDAQQQIIPNQSQIENKPIKINRIIDLINKNNEKIKNPQTLITLDEDQPSTSSRAVESYAAQQIELIRQQGLLEEEELKKLEKEFLKEEQRSKTVQKVGFFRRKTMELNEKRRKLSES